MSDCIPASLPVGQWENFQDGRQQKVFIVTGYHKDGKFNGTLSGQTINQGQYDHNSGKLTFIVVEKLGRKIIGQCQYTGYLYVDSQNAQISGTAKCSVKPIPGHNKKPSQHGWFAYIQIHTS